LEHGISQELVAELNSVELELRGFAFEGAGMGLALLDRLTPWLQSRLSQFLLGAGDAHSYMVHVAVGWVWARLPIRLLRTDRHLDLLLRWLAFDGWGFHEGYFRWPKYINGQTPPKDLAGYERRAFDQGLGRSFWFVNGGNPELMRSTISNFADPRQADLWSGLGLAATYAGGATREALVALREAAGPFGPQLAQGSAFAAKARVRAGNVVDYTQCATRVLCGLSVQEAARLTDVCLDDLPPHTSEPAYEIWRRQIQRHFQHQPADHPEQPPRLVCA
jgi:hypothetical protein